MNKNEAESKIEEFFKKKHNKNEVRKIKKIAMSFNIKLGKKRKLFCKKCNSMHLSVKRITKGMKVVECNDCKNLMRWKIN